MRAGATIVAVLAIVRLAAAADNIQVSGDIPLRHTQTGEDLGVPPQDRPAVAPDTRPRHRVRVRCDKAAFVAGGFLRVLWRDPENGLLKIWPGDWPQFGDDGSVETSLPAGEYRFELLHGKDENTLVALRSDRVMIPAKGPVELTADEPRVLSISPAVAPDLRLIEVGVRSISAGAQVTWTAVGDKPDDAQLCLVLSPGASYNIRAFARRGDVTAAIWAVGAVTARGIELSCPRDQLTSSSFKWDVPNRGWSLPSARRHGS
jgi:hypothetical protein